jgi:hypothetical protein
MLIARRSEHETAKELLNHVRKVCNHLPGIDPDIDVSATEKDLLQRCDALRNRLSWELGLQARPVPDSLHAAVGWLREAVKLEKTPIELHEEMYDVPRALLAEKYDEIEAHGMDQPPDLDSPEAMSDPDQIPSETLRFAYCQEAIAMRARYMARGFNLPPVPDGWLNIMQWLLDADKIVNRSAVGNEPYRQVKRDAAAKVDGWFRQNPEHWRQKAREIFEQWQAAQAVRETDDDPPSANPLDDCTGEWSEEERRFVMPTFEDGEARALLFYYAVLIVLHDIQEAFESIAGPVWPKAKRHPSGEEISLWKYHSVRFAFDDHHGDKSLVIDAALRAVEKDLRDKGDNGKPADETDVQGPDQKPNGRGQPSETTGASKSEAQFTDTEENILEALDNKHMTGLVLLKAAGYDYSSHYRGILSNLVKRGILGNDQTGYFRRHT